MLSFGYDEEYNTAHGSYCSKCTISDFRCTLSSAIITELVLIGTRKLASTLLAIPYLIIINGLILGHHPHLLRQLLSADLASETLSALKMCQKPIFLKLYLKIHPLSQFSS